MKGVGFGRKKIEKNHEIFQINLRIFAVFSAFFCEKLRYFVYSGVWVAFSRAFPGVWVAFSRAFPGLRGPCSARGILKKITDFCEKMPRHGARGPPLAYGVL